MAKTKQSEMARQCQLWRERGELEKLRAFEEASRKSKAEGNVVKTKAKLITAKKNTSGSRRNSKGKGGEVDPHPWKEKSVPDSMKFKRNIDEISTSVSNGAVELKEKDRLDEGVSPPAKKKRIFWREEDTLNLIMAIKAERDNANQKRADKEKVSKFLDWKIIANVINPTKANLDDVFFKKCNHKFDELKRYHKKDCPDGCDFINYMIGEYTKRIEESKGESKKL